MKTFKIDIPNDQMDFMLRLLNNLKFAYCEETEERSYPAKNYMIKKGLISESKTKLADTEHTEQINKFNELRQTIDRIQNSRDAQPPITSFAFRLPTTGAQSAKTEFASHTTLKQYLEEYFRVEIDNVTFKPFKGKKLQKDDNFEVVAHIKEANSKITRITAGYSNTTFDQQT